MDKQEQPIQLIEKDGVSYEYIRTAKRDGIAQGRNIFARCEGCGDLVPLLHNSACQCGNVIIAEMPDGKTICSGGKEKINLYREVIVANEVDAMLEEATSAHQKSISDALLTKNKPKPVKRNMAKSTSFSWRE